MKNKTIQDILDEESAIDFTYDSTKLAGNTLSKKEVADIIKKKEKKEIKKGRLFVCDGIVLVGYFDFFCEPDVKKEEKEYVFKKFLEKGLNEGKNYEKK